MERSVVFAGFGGQGILFAGQVLAHAAMEHGLEVVWIPSYGPEMRGGTASCTVIIGDEPIGSPVVDHPDAVVVMNPPSLAKFGPVVASGGLVVVNGSLVEAVLGRLDVTELRVPCTPLAREAGNDKLVTVVALGALIGRLGIVPVPVVHEAIRDTCGVKHADAVPVDVAALDLGVRFAAEQLAPAERATAGAAAG